MTARLFCLSALSVAIADNARRLAVEGNIHRAMRALALAEALHHEAGGDKVGKRLALAEAKVLRRAERRSQMNQEFIK
jgi:hypothetical protein